jgi:hypothetical protein
MGYKISWVVENRVLLATLDRLISLDELVDYRDTRGKMVHGSGNDSVHTIVDASQVDNKASQLPLSGMAKVFSHSNDSIGWGLVINAPSSHHWITSILLQVISGRYRMFTKPQEALDFLIDHDPSLSMLTVADLTHDKQVQ